MCAASRFATSALSFLLRRKAKPWLRSAPARLTPRRDPLSIRAMLQHNGVRAGKRAHIAHAAVVSLHALCCGLPALAMLAAAFSGAASSVVLLADFIKPFHTLLHAHEGWILGLSASLVVVGGVLEAWSRRGLHRHGFPWLFALSVACFLANLAIMAAHWTSATA